MLASGPSKPIPKGVSTKLRAIIALLALTVTAAAQITTGSVSGYVVDPSNRPIPKAKITVIDTQRLVTRSTLTDLTGYFRLADLPPAVYRVNVAAPEFATVVSPAVEVGVDAQARLDFKLPVSGRDQSITVHATTPAVPTESSDLGMVI